MMPIGVFVKKINYGMGVVGEDKWIYIPYNAIKRAMITFLYGKSKERM